MCGVGDRPAARCVGDCVVTKQGTEWEQQRDNDLWEWLCSLSSDELDEHLAELLGTTTEQVREWAERLDRKVRELLEAAIAKREEME